jgi:hypothetical protein
MTTDKDIDKNALAEELREVFDTVSPFIEKHTAIVCPDCENVCCMDKHGRYDEHDIIFLKALDVDIPADAVEREETDGCRYMTENGCSLERWMRPYRCTFFFCDALLKSLEGDNPKLYRAFREYFDHMVSTRQKLLD